MNLQPINPYNSIEESSQYDIELKENNLLSTEKEVTDEHMDNTGNGQNDK